MNDFDEQDDLWKLLGKARKGAGSPLFSRNVLREIRQSKQERTGLFAWLRSRWLPASACALAAILLSVSASHPFVQHKAPPPVVAKKADQSTNDASKPDDIDVINHLDELVAYEENSIWLEDSSN